VLCELSIEDRQTALVEAQELVSQARIDFQGALKLEAKGFNSDSAIAATKARLASAVAQLKRRQLNVEKILIRAPFAGVVEDVHVEIGDYVNPGQGCATIVDLNPMLMVGRVSEKDVLDLNLGELAIGVLADGRTVNGPVTFVGQQSDPQTRTYAVEIQLDNSDGALRSGITAEIKIPVERVLAQKISPALFALDDNGAIGVRVLDNNNVVHFHTIEIISEESDGVWVTGLPNQTTVITVGQEMVVAGERVDPDLRGRLTGAVAQSANAGT